jgi:formylglycine-generating enzyme required for sulfatase activity
MIQKSNRVGLLGSLPLGHNASAAVREQWLNSSSPPKIMTALILQKSRLTAQYFTEDLGNDLGLDMVQIPAGRFLMGSPDDELERQKDEGPQHWVNVPDFFMGKYPVTQAQWEVVAGWEEVDRPLKSNPANFKGPNKPIEQVSWSEVTEFCNRLSQHTNRFYRLPSEAEWEYACRAGTQTPFYFGETLTPDLANYDWDYTYGEYGVEKRKKPDRGTTPAGQFPPNAFGLYDMHGNVWEWCLDDWHSSYKGAPDDGSAWLDKTAKTASRKVLRGGSWIYYPRRCRSASRIHLDVDANLDTFGFRVVCAPPGLSSPLPS